MRYPISKEFRILRWAGFGYNGTAKTTAKFRFGQVFAAPDPERFDRAMESALRILPGAPAGLSQTDPTRGPVRSASKAFQDRVQPGPKKERSESFWRGLCGDEIKGGWRVP